MTKRVHQIDLLRFLAALSVVLYHYTFRGSMPPGYSDLEFPLLGQVFQYGNFGVELFFIISGFVISLSAKNKTVWQFARSRIVRLYPAYWFCLAVSAMMIYFFGAPKLSVDMPTVLANLTMLNGYFGVKYVDGVYWTLMVELTFYILTAVFLVSRKWVRLNSDAILLLWLLAAFIGPMFRDGSNTFHVVVENIFIFEFAQYFIAGVWLYKIFKGGITWQWTIGVVLCLLLAIWKNVQGSFVDDPHRAWAIIGVLTSCFGLMFLIAIGRLRGLNTPGMMSLGVLTYPLYLIHQYVGYIIIGHFSGMINKYVLLVLLVGFMVMVAYSIHRFVEKPLSKALDGWLRSIMERLDLN